MSRKLVAYFSASGTTKKTAEAVAQAGKFDLYEITPKEAYTSRKERRRTDSCVRRRPRILSGRGQKSRRDEAGRLH